MHRDCVSTKRVSVALCCADMHCHNIQGWWRQLATLTITPRLSEWPWLITGCKVLNDRCESSMQHWRETPWAKCHNVAVMYNVLLLVHWNGPGSAADTANVTHVQRAHMEAVQNFLSFAKWGGHFHFFPTQSSFIKSNITPTGYFSQANNQSAIAKMIGMAKVLHLHTSCAFVWFSHQLQRHVDSNQAWSTAATSTERDSGGDRSSSIATQRPVHKALFEHIHKLAHTDTSSCMQGAAIVLINTFLGFPFNNNSQRITWKQ